MDPELLSRVKKRVYNRLSRRDLSTTEIREDLLDRFGEDLTAADIEQALLELGRLGLVDDEKLTRRLIESLHRQGRGDRWIRAKLAQRGLVWPEDGAESTRESKSEAVTRAREWITRRVPDWSESYEQKQRALAGLARRGFSFSEALAILKNEA